MSDKKQFAVVMPDGSETFYEGSSHRYAAEEAVRLAKITQPRGGDGYTIGARVFELAISRGQVVRVNPLDVHVTPPRTAMTEDDYRRELVDAMSGLPDEFLGVVESISWEDGHSSGYEEVVGIAESLAERLAPAIRKYTERIGKRAKPAKEQA